MIDKEIKQNYGGYFEVTFCVADYASPIAVCYGKYGV